MGARLRGITQRLADAVSRHFPRDGRAWPLVKAVAGSLWLRLFGMALGFLVGVQLARGLGASGYGVYGIAMSIISLLLIPAEFGIPQLVVREMAATGANPTATGSNAILRWSTRYVLATCVVLGSAALALLHSGWFDLEPDLAHALSYGLLLLPLVALGNLMSAALRGFHRILDGQVAELVIRPAVVSLLLLATAAFLGSGKLSASLAMAINCIAALAGGVYAYARLRPMIGGSRHVIAPAGKRKAWRRSAIPLALGDGMRIVSGQVGILVLGAMASNDAVGIYRVAFGIYVVATIPSALLNAACSPMLAQLNSEGDMAKMRRLNAWMALFLVASGIACVVPFAVSGDWIVGTVFGREYASATPVLLVLLVGELMAATLGHPTIVLNMMHREEVVTRWSFLSLATNLLLCWLLVPRMGAIGAAIGVAASQFLWRLAASNYAFRNFGLHTSLAAWLRE